MLHACVERFDVMDRRENILGWDGEVNKAQVDLPSCWRWFFFCGFANFIRIAS
jgi:hypothetical protein